MFMIHFVPNFENLYPGSANKRLFAKKDLPTAYKTKATSDNGGGLGLLILLLCKTRENIQYQMEILLE